MFAVFNRAISRRSSCTLWRNSSIVVATVPFYTRGVRAVHKTEHLSAIFGSITPGDPSFLRPWPRSLDLTGRDDFTRCALAFSISVDAEHRAQAQRRGFPVSA